MTFQVDFLERKQQVKRYVSLVLAEERSLSKVIPPVILVQRQNVLKAGTFLILYNLVEATARSAIEAIHDEMITTRVSFEALLPEVRREVIRGFKRRSDPETHKNLKDIPVSLVAAALDTEHSFSGNVDARLLRELSKLYGFSMHSDTSKTRGGADLLTIKTNRNDLAHGHKTYEEVGRAYTGRDILSLAIRSTHFMEAVVQNVNDYITNKLYLEPPPAGD